MGIVHASPCFRVMTCAVITLPFRCVLDEWARRDVVVGRAVAAVLDAGRTTLLDMTELEALETLDEW